MAGFVQSIAQTMKKIWLAVTGKNEPAAAGVVLHDPAARRPHDLDDPFFDEKVQARVADVIAGAGQKK
jgi:hypothetical protein